MQIVICPKKSTFKDVNICGRDRVIYLCYAPKQEQNRGFSKVLLWALFNGLKLENILEKNRKIRIKSIILFSDERKTLV